MPDDSPVMPQPSRDVIRSEEELRVRTKWHAVERVRITKRIVTEEVQMTVAVRREELVVERAPAEDAGGAEAPEGGDPLDIVLLREEPVMTTRIVPVERVRVRVDRTSRDQEISGEVRAERVELDA